MSSDGDSPKKEGPNNAFTSAVIHASVNKDTLIKQQEKEKQQKQLSENQAKDAKDASVKKKGGLNLLSSSFKKPAPKPPTALVKKSPAKGKNADLDTSFDRKMAVDKITNRVEFIYIPTYQNMRKMIQKAVKI